MQAKNPENIGNEISHMGEYAVRVRKLASDEHGMLFIVHMGRTNNTGIGSTVRAIQEIEDRILKEITREQGEA